MTEAVSHRGPDGRAVWLKERVALGHRRLAIIDPETGQQPMSNADSSLWITYNGEVYNYRELRGVLEDRGYHFRTRSDTEVVLLAYEQWGTGCLEKLRGMFAFAIADFRKRRLFLARDHFGIKPLYYRLGAGYVAFASEIGALRLVRDSLPSGDLQAVDLFLRHQYIPAPNTIYRDMHKLLPAHYLLVGMNGEVSAPAKYWDFSFEPREKISDAQWVDRAKSVIHESVKAHLVADVPFGVCLSGGIDSTLVALQMCRVLEQPVKAFAIGFDNEEFSELAYARQVADKCGIELFTEIVDSTALDFLPDLVAHYGEPFGDSSMVPTWHVSRLAREHVPMVLSGDGGDETFGGYASYIDWLRKPWLHALDLARSSWRRAAGYCGREISSRVRTGSWNNLVEWHKLTGYTGEIWRRRLWRNENHSLIDQPCALFDESGATCGAWDRLSFAQYLDYKTYLPCDILTKVDVASMYHGLEVRTPLLDIKVIELASALPRRARIRNVKGQGMIGKWVVKEILKEDFPRDFVYRGKQGFSIPRSAWFQPGRSGRKLAQELLLDRASLLNEWFKPEQIQWFLGAHDENHDYSGILWLLLILGIWRSQNAEISFT